MPAYRATEDEGIGILDSPISDEPIPLSQALALLQQHVDRPGVTEAASGFLAFIPASNLYPAALGDYLAAVTNRYVGVNFASPGAAKLERMLLGWLAEVVGYPATAAGDLTSGGSLASLVGIVTAREAHQLRAVDFSRAVVYLSEQTHHCIPKALRIAGLKECVLRYIPLDAHYRMQPEALEAAIQRDRQAGLIPWLIAATAGTTDTGAVDPLPALADLAQAHGLWLHVDGAYGAMFALCELGQKILAGIEQSDSLVLDPHKGLFIPLGSGAVLIKNGGHLLKAHHYQANYLQDLATLSISGEVSQADLSPELSRPFRGLRLWLPLKLLGMAPFRAALEEKLLLARYFYQQIQQRPGFVVGPPPDLSIVPFYYQPKRGDVNAFNQNLIHAVQQDGRIFLSSTMLKNQFTLRLAILGFRTHLDTIELALEILQQKAKELELGER
jgi:glutamate/tyrosine decarboxylase-like PLP-dependent enzyme